MVVYRSFLVSTGLFADASALVQQNQRTEAIAVLMQALRADPDNAALRWRLGQLHYELGAFDFAESHLIRALALGTSPSSVMPLLAKILLARDDFNKLFELELPAATSSDARAEVLAQQALGLARLERFDQAQSRMQEALRLAPDSEAVGVGRARLLLEQGERDPGRGRVSGTDRDLSQQRRRLGWIGRYRP
jgi:Flp pilus assembly protein TadD